MITLIVAMAENRAIGKGNQMLWHLPEDLRRFRKLTEGHPIIMGRKTYESIGSKPLPKRHNIVVSRREDWFEEGILIVGNLKEAIKFAKKMNDKIFIIGGAEIYKQTIDIADVLEVTLVKTKLDGDAFFPEISSERWSLVEEVFPQDGAEFDFVFRTYHKK